jgi:hypothetical protein
MLTYPETRRVFFFVTLYSNSPHSFPTSTPTPFPATKLYLSIQRKSGDSIVSSPLSLAKSYSLCGSAALMKVSTYSTVPLLLTSCLKTQPPRKYLTLNPLETRPIFRLLCRAFHRCRPYVSRRQWMPNGCCHLPAHARGLNSFRQC